MTRWHRTASFVAAMLLVGASALTAQESIEPREPLFLLASASPTRAPVVVDAGSVASLRRRVSLRLDGLPLTAALAEVARVSGLQIVYADGVIPAASRVHLRAEEITVAGALTDMLLDAGVDVVLMPGGSVVLVKRGAVLAAGTVSGTVTDAGTHQPVEGAAVWLSGISRRTATGADGRYRLTDVRSTRSSSPGRSRPPPRRRFPTRSRSSRPNRSRSAASGR